MIPRPKILLDCDPGIDDAFALFCALKYADLAAITTASGNVSIENTTRNARFLMDLADADVPVHRGASRPLVVASAAADDIHGASGLGETVVSATRDESPVGAVDAILDHCRDGDATIVATGPLTNIAAAIQTDPSLADRIGHLYWMGGGTEGGNVTEFAEFNAWADPDAVDITLQSGAPLTMFGLNLTHQVRMGEAEIHALRDAETESAVLFADLLTFYRNNSDAARIALGQPMHDPCALLGLTHPALFETVSSNIVASVPDDARRGETSLVTNTDETPHVLAVTADAPAAISLILAAAIDPSPIS